MDGSLFLSIVCFVLGAMMLVWFLLQSFASVRFTVVPFPPKELETKTSEEQAREIADKVIDGLSKKSVWIEVATAYFVDRVKGYESAVADGSMSTAEASRRFHADAQYLHDFLMFNVDSSPKAQEEATP